MAEAKTRRGESLTFPVAFLLFLLGCFLFSGCASTGKKTGPEAEVYRLEIQNVLDTNFELVRVRDEALKKSKSNREDSAIYDGYSKGLRFLEITECPRDFRAAFMEYIHSVEDVSSKIAKEPEGMGLGTLLRLIDFSPTVIFKVISELGRPERERAAIAKEVEAALAKSQQRWRKVEMIAVQYRVSVQAPQVPMRGGTPPGAEKNLPQS
ncbi:MAG TPA: hypothetical protein VLS90_03935 [Thermodesulfobacteriota bacterium]|nr:hypothetical protein [Thermodesulfobacteriota bacterium]